MRIIGIKLIHCYRYLASPWVGNQCRFYPTCSHYAEEAIEQYGLLKGSVLAARRLLKCHPWHSGGVDEVPVKQRSVKQKPIEQVPVDRQPSNNPKQRQ